jgi:hypothetical protein
MHTPAVYMIAVLLFILSGLLLFSAGSSWAKIAQHRDDSDQPVPRATFRAAAGLTAASFGLLGAALLWAVSIAFFVHI